VSGLGNHENNETHEKARPEFCDSFVNFVPFVVVLDVLRFDSAGGKSGELEKVADNSVEQ